MRHSMNNMTKACRYGKLLRNRNNTLEIVPDNAVSHSKQHNDRTCSLCTTSRLRRIKTTVARAFRNSVEHCTANVLPNSNATIFFTANLRQLSADNPCCFQCFLSFNKSTKYSCITDVCY